MPAQGRIGDKSNVPMCSHGCPACPHPCIGPGVQGSPDVKVNGRPALRMDDPGIHGGCCMKNDWEAAGGSATVYINGKPAHRLGDQGQHCGGMGKLTEGSSNVMTGGPEHQRASALHAEDEIALRMTDVLEELQHTVQQRAEMLQSLSDINQSMNDMSKSVIDNIK